MVVDVEYRGGSGESDTSARKDGEKKARDKSRTRTIFSRKKSNA